MFYKFIWIVLDSGEIFRKVCKKLDFSPKQYFAVLFFKAENTENAENSENAIWSHLVRFNFRIFHFLYVRSLTVHRLTACRATFALLLIFSASVKQQFRIVMNRCSVTKASAAQFHYPILPHHIFNVALKKAAVDSLYIKKYNSCVSGDSQTTVCKAWNAWNCKDTNPQMSFLLVFLCGVATL